MYCIPQLTPEFAEHVCVLVDKSDSLDPALSVKQRLHAARLAGDLTSRDHITALCHLRTWMEGLPDDEHPVDHAEQFYAAVEDMGFMVPAVYADIEEAIIARFFTEDFPAASLDADVEDSDPYISHLFATA